MHWNARTPIPRMTTLPAMINWNPYVVLHHIVLTTISQAHNLLQVLTHMHKCMHAHTHTNTYTQPFNDPLSRTTQVGRYQKKHSPIHTHPDHQTSFINFLHLLRSIAYSLFNLLSWQSFTTTSLQVLFGLGPFASCSILFFTQSSSSFHNTCPPSQPLLL